MTTDEDAVLRTIATRRVRAKREFYMHATAYLIIQLALAGIWLMTGGGYPWFVWPMLGWGIGVLFHGLTVAFRVDAATPLDPRDERAIQREVARLRRAPTGVG